MLAAEEEKKKMTEEWKKKEEVLLQQVGTAVCSRVEYGCVGVMCICGGIS